MAKVVLFVFDRLARGLRWLGVDYPQFRALLGVKLTLDGRRQFTAFQRQGGKAPRNAFALTLLMNVFMGIFVALFITLGPPPLVTLTVVHAFVMGMVTLSLIADFSSVLLDTTDNAVLLPRPISSRTILAARMAHIATYVLLLTLSLSAATFVVGTYRFGPAFLLVFLLTLAALVALVLSIVNILYLMLLRLTDGERLRDLIAYVQVGMTILTVCGYQLLPRLLDVNFLSAGTIADRWWVYLVPPAWFAAPFELTLGHVTAPHLVLTALGVVVPLASLAAASALAPRFREALARLESTPVKRAARGGQLGRSGLSWARWLTRAGPERAAFELLWAISGRDRQFKLRTYPNVALALVFAGILVLSGHDFATLPTTQRHLLALYAGCALAPTAFLQIRFSDQYEAAWIYRALPLALPGDVLLAAVKVVFVRLVLPTFALLAAATLTIWGPQIIADQLLALCALALICALYTIFMGHSLPFSEPLAVRDSSGRVNRIIFYLLLSAALGGLHYMLTLVPYGVLAAVPVVAGAAWATLRSCRRTTWQQVLAEANK